MAGTYSTDFRGLTFHDAVPRFRDGTDTPRAYLERCLETVAAREPVVQAFASLNQEAARAAADASTARYRAGRPLSPLDGMPVGIKDLLETKDHPTQMGCEAYAGNFPKRDNAAVTALRQAGAVIFGKTVTAEIGGSHPGPTTNPWNPAHTPGGSSSGSAAAVAAGFMPAAIGTQVGGSIIRPAAYCGNLALKPSQGAINRGERLATSMSTHGPHANCVEDLWAVAIEIALRAGGDRGCVGLQGPRTTPAPVKPQRLVVMQGEGWGGIDAASTGAFEAVLDQLRAQGIEVIRRQDHALVERFEQGIGKAKAVTSAITGWENHWNTRNLVDNNPGKVSARAMQALLAAEQMTPADYALLLAQREEAQARHKALAPLCDAVISLACPGPAPLWAGDQPGQPLAPRPTGDSVMNTPSSMLFAPVVTMPLIAVDGLPVGVQLLGQQQDDARMVALARWMMAAVKPVTA